ncbi:hypothetical protein PHISP_05699 [Aspergillus sp. HF37]|nr:hypothetical protein PHISP_05699 [Aspergillus sp. HF37]
MSSRAPSLRRRVFLISAVFLVFVIALLIFPKCKPSPSPEDASVPLEQKAVSFPPEYSMTPFESRFCADRFGIPYLEHLRDSATEYCTSESSSALTCFHAKITDTLRIDTMCIGQDSGFDPATRKFRLGCELRELNESKTSVPIPKYGKFNNYWYRTGPQVIFDESVVLWNKIRSQERQCSPNYTILTKREGSKNLWHCLMEIFSMTIALDVLQISTRPNDSRPFLTAANAENTQVVFLDDEDDGPYFDLWSVFAQKPTLRMKDVPGITSFENIIVPLAGGSNPFWQGDWEAHSCEDSALLRTFSRRILNFYDVGAREPRQGDWIVVTFIDRVENRRLVDQERYLELLRSTFAHIKVQSIDFAIIPFNAQLEVIRDTDLLLGVHGAGLTHAMFLQPRSSVVEILPSSFNHKGFRNVAGVMGHSYFSAHASEQPLRKRKDWQHDDVYLEQDKFMELMNIAIKATYKKGHRNYDTV